LVIYQLENVQDVFTAVQNEINIVYVGMDLTIDLTNSLARD